MYKGISLYILGIATGLCAIVMAVNDIPAAYRADAFGLAVGCLLVGGGFPMIGWQVYRNLQEEALEQEEPTE